MSKPSFNLTRRSAYNSWVPQTNETHNNFVLDVIKRTDKQRKNKEAHLPEVDEFDKAVSPEQKELFESALRQVGQYYSEVRQNRPSNTVKLFFKIIL